METRHAAQILFLLVVITPGLCSEAAAWEPIERRRDQFGKDFSYFVSRLLQVNDRNGNTPGASRSSANL